LPEWAEEEENERVKKTTLTKGRSIPQFLLFYVNTPPKSSIRRIRKKKKKGREKEKRS